MFRRKLFYGWWVAIALLVVMGFSHGVAFHIIPVMLPNLIEEFGWSRAAVSGLASVLLLTLGVLGLPVGLLCDRWGAQRVMLLSAPFLAAALVLVSTVHRLWQLYAVYLLLSLAATGLHTVPVSAAITRWFNQHRGAAMGLALSGMNLGGAVAASMAGVLNATMGWRSTFVIMGVAAGVMLLPLIGLVVKSGPAPEQPRAAEGTTPSPRGNRLLRQPSFWLITVSFALAQGGVAGVLTHQVAFLIDSGMNPITAAGTLGVVIGFGVAGKLGGGYLSDRMSSLWLTFLLGILMAASVLVFMVSQTPQAVWAYVVVFGLAMGAVPVMLPLVLGDLFGSATFGANYGWMTFFVYLGTAIGPPFAGYIYDSSGSYTGAFTTFVVAYLVSVVCLVLARWRHQLRGGGPPLPPPGRCGRPAPAGRRREGSAPPPPGG